MESTMEDTRALARDMCEISRLALCGSYLPDIPSSDDSDLTTNVSLLSSAERNVSERSLANIRTLLRLARVYLDALSEFL